MLIAGTYTPFCLLLPGGGRALLAGVWAGAVAGMVLSVAWPLAPKWLMAALTVGLGWIIVPLLPSLHGAIGARGLWLSTPPGGRTPSRASSATTRSSTCS